MFLTFPRRNLESSGCLGESLSPFTEEKRSLMLIRKVFQGSDLVKSRAEVQSANPAADFQSPYTQCLTSLLLLSIRAAKSIVCQEF